MPPLDPAGDARRWFLKAYDDLRAGDLDLSAAPPLVEDAMFHAQQAVEKAVKGFLVWHGQTFRKIHDLREVGGAAVAIDPSFQPLLQQAVRLSPFAGVFRYPTDMGTPTADEAREALALARRVYDAMFVCLPSLPRP